ncbi:lipoyl domain-containing protein [bacterium]|nr:lipoyl domain-containing protein [bacterium]
MAKVDFDLKYLADELKDVTFVSWFVEEGQEVKEGDDLCEIVTDKASLTLSVPADGTISELKCQKNDKLEGGTVLLSMEVK